MATGPIGRAAPALVVLALLLALGLQASGGLSRGPAPTASPRRSLALAPVLPQSTPSASAPATLAIPDAARASDGGGGPRPAAYWAQRNMCAPDNRADVARANGGREAGWVLVDDLLADPGNQPGDHLRGGPGPLAGAHAAGH
ncbi:MAG: hypothetical protein HPY83_05155 [Anaerolineae bacterium]|nr:hypothetical protein [Anaerolineae bacterium]